MLTQNKMHGAEVLGAGVDKMQCKLVPAARSNGSLKRVLGPFIPASRVCPSGSQVHAVGGGGPDGARDCDPDRLQRLAQPCGDQPVTPSCLSFSPAQEATGDEGLDARGFHLLP